MKDGYELQLDLEMALAFFSPALLLNVLDPSAYR
jgi:hypothetical protein